MLPTLFWTNLIALLILFSSIQNEISIHQQADIHLVADFQSEIGCKIDWDVICELTEFKKAGESYRLKMMIPASTWNFKVLDQGVYYGRNNAKDVDAYADNGATFIANYLGGVGCNLPSTVQTIQSVKDRGRL